MSERYAVKVCISKDPEDWIYVTERPPEAKNYWDLRPVTFESSMAAEDFADLWRTKDPRNAKVVVYKGDEDEYSC